MQNEYKTVTDKKIKSFFYRDSFYKMFKWLFIYFAILIICVIWAIHVYQTKPKRKYYAITQYGVVQELKPETKI